MSETTNHRTKAIIKKHDSSVEHEEFDSFEEALTKSPCAKEINLLFTGIAGKGPFGPVRGKHF